MLDKSKPFSEERTQAGIYYMQDGKKYRTDGEPMLEEMRPVETPFDLETASLIDLREKAVELGLKIDMRWGVPRLRDEVRQALSV